MSSEQILVKVSGPDKPGITHQLLSIIDRDHCSVVDMGQSVTHGLLSLSILIQTSESESDYPVIKDLLFRAKKLGMVLDFNILEGGSAQPKTVKKRDRFILHSISTKCLPTGYLKETAGVLAANGVNIHRIDCTNPDRFNSLEITTTLGEKTDLPSLKKELMQISNRYQVDAAFLRDNVWLRNKRLIVFDMDSTLIQTEVIDEMAIEHGVGEEVIKITESAMNGEIDFDESLKRRVKLLEGMPESSLQNILERLKYTSGVQEFVEKVKVLGYKLAVISGGFTFFANAIKKDLGLDYAFANELEIINGKLTGNVKGTIINADQKSMIMGLIAQQEGLHKEQVVAIGDGANDLPMLTSAGLGIAYHAKEIVREKAGQQLGHGPMTSILHFLGVSEEDIEQIN
jgi:phosphoserine phosphatase